MTQCVVCDRVFQLVSKKPVGDYLICLLFSVLPKDGLLSRSEIMIMIIKIMKFLTRHDSDVLMKVS